MRRRPADAVDDPLAARDVAERDLDPKELDPRDPGVRAKWRDPVWTARGERRAVVPLGEPGRPGAETIWVNTGTLCNIACHNCYIESSPNNDRLAYLNRAELAAALDDAAARGWRPREIGFTGGEPFLNPEIIGLLEEALERGARALVLTNAMRPMLRPKIKAGLLALRARYGAALGLRVSLDHWTAQRHDEERGAGAFAKALAGTRWLAREGFALAVAGRSLWGEPEADARAGFATLFAEHDLPIDAHDPAACVIFPEMTPRADPPEITTACWDILGKRPASVMCASARMLVKRKGAERTAWLACTLIPYDPAFELGATAAEAEAPVALKHPYCATFCVLGGASCSG